MLFLFFLERCLLCLECGLDPFLQLHQLFFLFFLCFRQRKNVVDLHFIFFILDDGGVVLFDRCGVGVIEDIRLNGGAIHFVWVLSLIF